MERPLFSPLRHGQNARLALAFGLTLGLATLAVLEPSPQAQATGADPAASEPVLVAQASPEPLESPEPAASPEAEASPEPNGSPEPEASPEPVAPPEATPVPPPAPSPSPSPEEEEGH